MCCNLSRNGCLLFSVFAIQMVITTVTILGAFFSNSIAMESDAFHISLDCLTYFLSFYAQYDRDRRRQRKAAAAAIASASAAHAGADNKFIGIEGGADSEAHVASATSDGAAKPDGEDTPSASASRAGGSPTWLELSAAMATCLVLMTGTLLLIVEAIDRLVHRHSSEIQGVVMVVTTGVGLALCMVAFTLFFYLEPEEVEDGPGFVLLHAHSHGPGGTCSSAHGGGLLAASHSKTAHAPKREHAHAHAHAHARHRSEKRSASASQNGGCTHEGHGQGHGHSHGGGSEDEDDEEHQHGAGCSHGRGHGKGNGHAQAGGNGHRDRHPGDDDACEEECDHAHHEHDHEPLCSASASGSGSGSAATTATATERVMSNVNIFSAAMHVLADVLRTLSVLVAAILIITKTFDDIETDAYSSLIVSALVVAGCLVLFKSVGAQFLKKWRETKELELQQKQLSLNNAAAAMAHKEGGRGYHMDGSANHRDESGSVGGSGNTPVLSGDGKTVFLPESVRNILRSN